MTTSVIHADDSERSSADRKWTFWMTLLVTTLLVALTAYVLRGAFLNPSENVPKTQRAAAAGHARS